MTHRDDAAPPVVRADLLLGLPGLPRSRGGLSKWLDRRGILPARIEGQGGANEYELAALASHVDPLTFEAIEERASSTRANSASGNRYDRARDHSRQRAQERERAVVRVARLVADGALVLDALKLTAREFGVSWRSVAEWRRRAGEAPIERRRDALCHRLVGVPRAKFTREQLWFAVFYEHYMTRKSPSIAAAWRRAQEDSRLAGAGPLPDLATVRRIKRQLSGALLTRKRIGPDAERRTRIRQRIDRSGLRPYEILVSDGHTPDWSVRWADGSVARGELMILVDEFSGMVVGWELDRSENAAAVRRMVKRTFLELGTPEELRVDNGAGFSAKELTAGSVNRHRGKERPDDVPGAIVRAGVQVRFYTPGCPWQKGRCERMFGVIEGELRAHPALPEGAYLGNAPHRAPDGRGSRPVDEATFRAVLAETIERVNTLPSDGANCDGRSRSDAFHEQYDRRLHGSLSAIEEKTFLLPAREVTPNRLDGAIHLAENRFWDQHTAQCVAEATGPRRRTVVIYYDPEDYQAGVWVHSRDGEFLGPMPCLAAIGYHDEKAQRDARRTDKRLARATREQEAALDRLEEIAPPAVLEKRPDLRERRTARVGKLSRDERHAMMLAQYEADDAAEATASPRGRAVAG